LGQIYVYVVDILKLWEFFMPKLATKI